MYRRWNVKWIFLQVKWISQYLSRPPAQRAEIWPPGILLQYIWTLGEHPVQDRVTLKDPLDNVYELMGVFKKTCWI